MKTTAKKAKDKSIYHAERVAGVVFLTRFDADGSATDLQLDATLRDPTTARAGQVALAILSDFAGPERALDHWQALKEHLLRTWSGRSGHINSAELRNFLALHERGPSSGVLMDGAGSPHMRISR